MNALIVGLFLLVCSALVWIQPTAGPSALVMCAVVSAPTILILARTHDDRTFLLRLFLVGLMVRIVLASIIYMGHMEEFFGGDAITYDTVGQSLLRGLYGDDFHMQIYQNFASS